MCVWNVHSNRNLQTVQCEYTIVLSLYIIIMYSFVNCNLFSHNGNLTPNFFKASLNSICYLYIYKNAI